MNTTQVYSNVTNPHTAAMENPLTSKEPWYWMVRGLIALVTIFGNGLVVYLISTRKVLREQASPNWFVLSMAVADFGVGFVNFPLNMLYAFTSNRGVIVWSFLGLLQNVFLDASITNLALLTFDRYLAVVHPFTYETFMTPRKAFLLVIQAWTITIILEIPYLVLDLQQASNDAYLVHLIIYMILFSFLPSFFMSYAYGRILWVARRHRQRIKEHKKQLASNVSIRRRMAQNGNKNGAMVTVGTIVLIFLICNFVTEYYLTCFLIPSCHNSPSTGYVGYAFLLLRYLNSTPNFIVYAFMKKDFRRELRKAIRRTHARKYTHRAGNQATLASLA